MNEEFHYYTVAVVARAAGFCHEEAVTLAYASQYVDDATESEPIRVGKTLFEPVRTAYLGPFATSWSVQKRIYIPFHFLPPHPMDGGPVDFVTRANSPFARALVNAAAREVGKGGWLCRLGVALHTYADSWAHEGFSGRLHEENDIEDIHQLRNRRWRPLGWQNVVWDFLPDIGHAEAGNLPDLAWVTWRYRKAGATTPVVRENPRLFLRAARAIYGRLRRLLRSSRPPQSPWKALAGTVAQLLADPQEEAQRRCRAWQEVYRGLFGEELPTYDRYTWRSKALAPIASRDLEWDSFKPDDFRHLRFPGGSDFLASNWVAFHRAALRQRHLVLEQLL